MSEGISLFATLAWGFGLAFLLGYLANKLRIPALVGYLLAGICIAPTTPGFVGDVGFASQLSEIGVTLLMFGVGLSFSVKDLLRVKAVAVPGALLQMACTTGLGMSFGLLSGWSFMASFILGLCLSCASTVVMVKALQSHGALESGEGQVAVGWLVVEDMVSVLLLVLLPSLAAIQGKGSMSLADLSTAMGETSLLIVGFIATMVVVGRRVLPWALMKAAQTGSREIFTLCVVSIAICIAYAASEIFKVSFALGAFFAGMMMRESEYAHRAAQDTLPLQDAFSVIFFLGVGMLFDPSILWSRPAEVLCVVVVIFLGNGLASIAVVKLLGYNWRYALTIGAGLAQVGEFSFILAALAVDLNFMPKELMTLILAGSIISIALNPLLFRAIEPLLAKLAPERPLPSPVVWGAGRNSKRCGVGQVVIVGYNIMGRSLYDALMDKGYPTLVIEQNVNRISSPDIMRNFVLGDARQHTTLDRARIGSAELVILTIRDALTERKIVDEIRVINPDVQIMALISTDGDRDFFKGSDGLMMENVVCMDIRNEVAKNLLNISVGLMRVRSEQDQ